MRIPWIGERDSPEALPDPAEALDEPNGLLAAGGALTPEWLLHAYRHGIFPWYTRGQPILWWSPDPRCVLWPAEFRVSRSLAKSIRNRGYEAHVDCDFAGVLDGCAAPREGESGTWITPAMRRAYLELHRLGHAHSVEIRHGDRLVGGLYGVRVGGMFYGESMFSRERDASKVAMARLVELADEWNVRLIDCQLPTPHLESLGATVLPRVDFLQHVAELTTGTRSGESAGPAGFAPGR